MNSTAIFVALALLATIGLLAWAARWRQRRASEKLHLRLRRKVLGDEAAARRLIEYERRRNPKATEDALVRAALQRLERDNR